MVSSSEVKEISLGSIISVLRWVLGCGACHFQVSEKRKVSTPFLVSHRSEVNYMFLEHFCKDSNTSIGSNRSLSSCLHEKNDPGKMNYHFNCTDTNLFLSRN